MKFLAAGLPLLLVTWLSAEVQPFIRNRRQIHLLPDEEEENCVKLQQCPTLFSLLNSQPVTEKNIRKLQKAHCGFEGNDPKVLCPSLNPEDLSTHRNFLLLPSSRNCGHQLPNAIVGGSEAPLGAYPWIVRIGYSTPTVNLTYQCAGSLINSRYVLTAAHCLLGLPNGVIPVAVRLGEHNDQTKIDCIQAEPQDYCADLPQDFQIEKITIHEKFHIPEQNDNDIALIRLNRDVKETSWVSPVCLPFQEVDLSQLVRVAGWGRTNPFLNVGSPTLQHIRVPIVTLDDCTKSWQGYLHSKRVFQRNKICAVERGTDSCKGDSGGPMMAVTLNELLLPQFTLIGIVSFGVPDCGNELFPGVYTRVKAYTPWILDNLEP